MIAYPDGIFRLAVLYVLTIVTLAVLLLLTPPKQRTSFLHSQKRPRRTKLFLFPVILYLVAPVLVGYLYGVVKWIAEGWWDPIHSGRAMIYCSGFLFLTVLLLGVKEFKEGLFERFVAKWQKALFALFLVMDVLGLLTNIRTVWDWFFK